MAVATPTTTPIPRPVLDHIHPEPTGFIRKYIFSIDHKIIAYPVLHHGRTVLRHRGLAGRDDPHPAAQAQRRFVDTQRLQSGVLGARLDDGVAGHHPARHRRVRQFRDAAANRCARRRVSVAEPGRVLDVSAGGLDSVGSFLVGAPDAGWTEYPPISLQAPFGTSMWCVAIFLIGISSTLTGINFLVTIFKMRAPGMTFTRMPLFVWASAATAG